jgi:hypothetical protein
MRDNTNKILKILFTMTTPPLALSSTLKAQN